MALCYDLFSHSQDYPRVDQVSIFSFAEIRLDPEIDIRQKTTNDYAEAETKAYPDSSLYQRSEGAPWWVIALGVIIGILILVAIAYCLYKVQNILNFTSTSCSMLRYIHKVMSY